MIDTKEPVAQPAVVTLSLREQQALTAQRPRWNRLNRNLFIGAALVLLIFLLAWAGPWLLPYDPLTQDLNVAMQPPSRDHLLGTDQFGRDVLTRILYGLRIDLQIGIIATLGREAGVATPAIETLVALIHDIEDGKLPMSAETFAVLSGICEG